MIYYDYGKIMKIQQIFCVRIYNRLKGKPRGFGQDNEDAPQITAAEQADGTYKPLVRIRPETLPQ